MARLRASRTVIYVKLRLKKWINTVFYDVLCCQFLRLHKSELYKEHAVKQLRRLDGCWWWKGRVGRGLDGRPWLFGEIEEHWNSVPICGGTSFFGFTRCRPWALLWSLSRAHPSTACALKPRPKYNKSVYRGIGLAVTRHLLRKFNVNVVAISRSRTPELLELSSESLLIVNCDMSVSVLLAFGSVNLYSQPLAPTKKPCLMPSPLAQLISKDLTVSFSTQVFLILFVASGTTLP